MKDDDCDVRIAAMNACQGRDVPVEIIERGLKDYDCDVRATALNACQGRDVPVEIIERWLKDDDWRVRAAALNACQGRDVPGFKRTFEPPKIVYKKCINDVIVSAKIPDSAFVRGGEGEKCRSSQAKIIDVIGDVGGVKVGISIFDKKTMYFPDDEITIDDFDMSADKCSTGFHFFCTKEEAENFQF